MTQPGSASALSFIYESHYQCTAEQNNSDVMAFISLGAFSERYNPLWPPPTVAWKLKIFSNSLRNTITKKILVLYTQSTEPS